MTTHDSHNLNTPYEQRELDMLPQTGTTKAQTVGETGNHVSGDHSAGGGNMGNERQWRVVEAPAGELISREAAIAVCRDIADEWADHTATVHLSDGADECVARLRALPAAPGAGEIERLRKHADRGWHLFAHWNARYLDCASDRDRIEGRLAEVEAERDAIGAAMVEACAKAMGTFHWNRYADERLSGTCVFSSHTHQKVEQICRALANPSSKATLDKLIADAVQAENKRLQAYVDAALIPQPASEDAQAVAYAVAEWVNRGESDATVEQIAIAAVEAFKRALAAQGEPVAWVCWDLAFGCGTKHITSDRHLVDARTAQPNNWLVSPLYAHPAPASAGVTVKPLVWSDDEFPSECFQAGDYAIWKEAGKYQLHFWSIVEGEPHLTLEAAQSAAWEHHKARVLAALTTAQSAEVGE